jgi:hypothetical protein
LRVHVAVHRFTGSAGRFTGGGKKEILAVLTLLDPIHFGLRLSPALCPIPPPVFPGLAAEQEDH